MGIFFILLEPSFIPAEFIWQYLSRTRAQPSGSRAKVRSSKVSAPAIFQKKSPQAMRSLRRTGGAGGIPFPAGNATAVAARHWRPAKSRLSNPTRIKKHPSFDGCLLAERVGFEPTDGFTRQTISSRSRYDLFDTAPYGFAL